MDASSLPAVALPSNINTKRAKLVRAMGGRHEEEVRSLPALLSLSKGLCSDQQTRENALRSNRNSLKLGTITHTYRALLIFVQWLHYSSWAVYSVMPLLGPVFCAVKAD